MMDAFPKAKIHPSGNLGSMVYKSVSASAKKTGGRSATPGLADIYAYKWKLFDHRDIASPSASAALRSPNCREVDRFV
jgi:hypothetical protein